MIIYIIKMFFMLFLSVYGGMAITSCGVTGNFHVTDFIFVFILLVLLLADNVLERDELCQNIQKE